ncbi:hypothetical protein GCM10023223_44410 [Stackebrandtia albiflava]
MAARDIAHRRVRLFVGGSCHGIIAREGIDRGQVRHVPASASRAAGGREAAGAQVGGVPVAPASPRSEARALPTVVPPGPVPVSVRRPASTLVTAHVGHRTGVAETVTYPRCEPVRLLE